MIRIAGARKPTAFERRADEKIILKNRKGAANMIFRAECGAGSIACRGGKA